MSQMLATLGAENWTGPLIAFLQVVLIDLVSGHRDYDSLTG
jgi:hypothetical protein